MFRPALFLLAVPLVGCGGRDGLELGVSVNGTGAPVTQYDSGIVSDASTARHQDSGFDLRDSSPAVVDASTSDGSTVACVPSKGSGRDGSVDDLEDGDLWIRTADGRAGYWYAYNDGTGVQTPPSMATTYADSPGAHGSRFAAHTQGSGFTDWGGGFGFQLDSPPGVSFACTYDASAYTGMTFRAKGSATMTFAVQIAAVVDVIYAGTCTSACFDAHSKVFQLSDTWRTFVVPFSDLHQAGWGTPVPFDPTTIMNVQFGGGRPAFDIWVDDIAFY